MAYLAKRVPSSVAALMARRPPHPIDKFSDAELVLLVTMNLWSLSRAAAGESVRERILAIAHRLDQAELRSPSDLQRTIEEILRP